MKYFRQRDRYSCAAVAFLNAFKWMGINTSSKQLSSLKQMLRTTVKDGTTRRDSAWLAKSAGFKRVRKPTIAKLDAELIAGNALIVETGFPDRDCGHAYLIIRRTTRYFVCVNLFRNRTVVRVSKERIARRLLYKPAVYRVTPLEVGPNLVFYPLKKAA